MKQDYGKSPRFKQGALLSQFCAYKIGGAADYFFEAKNLEELKEAYLWAKRNSLPVFILGSGTNVLFSDKGFRGLVLKVAIGDLKLDGLNVEAGAGVLVSDLVEFAVKQGLAGLEWAGGLPGTLGGAVRGNAGCFGREIKDVLSQVLVFDGEAIKTYSNQDCRFTYRSSVFKNNNKIIIGAVLKLEKGNTEELGRIVQEHVSWRQNRQPLEYANCGSVFKNCFVENLPESLVASFGNKIKNDPVPLLPAAVLINEAGLTGLKIGDAQISTKHPNFIINLGNAKARDVIALIKAVKNVVKNQYNVDLQEEIQIMDF